MASFTKIYHNTTYPTISPDAPANSQDGRTVLVVGASEGIGFAIARAFTLAGAARVILTGRRREAVDDAASSLMAIASEAKISAEIKAYQSDMSSDSDISSVWKSLKNKGIHVHVLVLNAALASHSKVGPGHLSFVRESFEVNVLACFRMAHEFIEQAGVGGDHVSRSSCSANEC
jgi:short-subunit dehydrogenase